MSPSEPSEPGPGRRRKNSESDPEQAEPREGRRRGGSRRKGQGRTSPALKIVVGALALALIALGVVLVVQRGGGDDAAEAAPETRPVLYDLRLSDSSEMNRVLNSREDDQRPLNEGELFERSNEEISSQSIDFTLRDSDLTEDCTEAVWGSQVEDALAGADCTQAGRATYVADGYFGVAAVFNLADTEASQDVAAAMELPETSGDEEPDDPGFVLAPSGEEPFDRLGEGYSAADAIISGHYLVVVWVQPDDSESVDDRVTLSSPLVALANFRDPLYRRLVELRDPTDTGQEGGGTGGVEEGAPGGGAEDPQPPVEDPPPEEPPLEEPPVQEPGGQ
ncbi:hypothetical protein IDM40_01075 [Nocardiopsis sp. HNM0947]|uniref:Uncharacterized protein n=1 Tax=Nocardiopsis coralli TaxID=2772213 RepID=A0ABR9P0D5_9ACTN|nr:hypothetical protein [Nocardiopsis coralli]MBE2997297.1 hypothetical protein [Nocardiopsis coralli]